MASLMSRFCSRSMMFSRTVSRPIMHRPYPSFSSTAQTQTMLRIGDTAPNFAAETTSGKLDFHEYIGDSWCILFSHPADYTPVCTTELGVVEKYMPEFQKRNVKCIGLSCDPLDDHHGWIKDIVETQGLSGDGISYPIIADKDRSIAKLYSMLDDSLIAKDGP